MQCKNHLIYLTDLLSKFYVVLKRLHGKNVTIIKARTIIHCFQAKVDVLKYSLARNHFNYFSNIRMRKYFEKITGGDIEIYVNLLDKIRNDFKIRFWELDYMLVSEWLVTPFGMKIVIIEHLLKRIFLTVHQSSCCLTLIDIIINRHIKFNMLKT